MKTLLKCYDCKVQLNEFEEKKFHKLIDYWGGRKPIWAEPRCRSCYYKDLDKRKVVINNG